MNKIKITVTKQQTATCDQLDAIARNYIGLQTSLDNTDTPLFDAEVDLDGVSIKSTDGVYPDTKALLEEKGATVSGTENQRILDDEVRKVLATNMYSDESHKIVASDFKNLTSIETWFKDNTSIISFDELGNSGVTSLVSNAFSGCTKLKSVCLKNITTASSFQLFYLCTSIESVNFENLTSLGLDSRVFYGCSNLKQILMPKLEYVQGYTGNPQICYGTNVRSIMLPSLKNISGKDYFKCDTIVCVDFGVNLTSTTFYLGVASGYNLIVRAATPPSVTTTSNMNAGKIFVQSSVVDTYKAADNWSTYASKIYAIGGEEWQSAMQTLASSEGYTLQDGESWADEYIDYKIYGVEPPTE